MRRMLEKGLDSGAEEFKLMTLDDTKKRPQAFATSGSLAFSQAFDVGKKWKILEKKLLLVFPAACKIALSDG